MVGAVNVVLLVPYPQAEVLRAVVRRTDSGVLGLPVLKDQFCPRTAFITSAVVRLRAAILSGSSQMRML